MIVKKGGGKSLPPHEKDGKKAWGNVLAYGGNLMFTEFNFEKGSGVPVHTHPHEQLTMVIKGKLLFKKGDKEFIAEEGDSMYFAPNEVHGVLQALEDSKVIDAFTPQREDFLKKIGEN
ncbi:MAG TPA: cupin domain-containing protein [Candidatus Atribacteria bacterium]|nr:cupin domain-containing protein [Candidatus Atribacteria bacterium]